jgi:hypothetical protein
LWTPDEESQASRRYKTFSQNYIDNDKLGMLHYQEAAGWNTVQTEGFIDACIKNTEELNTGREEDGVPTCEPVFIIDYYSLIEVPSQWQRSNVPLNLLAQWLKQLVARKKLYMLTLVQEQEGESDNQNQYPKGGNEILKQSQVFMRLSRSRATDDYPYAPNGQVLTNMVGEDRYLHKMGQWHHSLRLDVIKANDDETGQVQLVSEMSLLNIAQA